MVSSQQIYRRNSSGDTAQRHHSACDILPAVSLLFIWGRVVVRKEVYAHFFLFTCSACRGHLASVCSSSQRNLEPAEGHIFSLHCHCGWIGELAGFMALRHWVELGEHIDLNGMPDCSIVLDKVA